MTPPIIELTNVSKRFVKPLDAAEKVANLFGTRFRQACNELCLLLGILDQHRTCDDLPRALRRGGRHRLQN